MSEEEKKAIEIIKDYMSNPNINYRFKENLEIALNLIQEQQKKIEDLKIANDQAWEEWNNLEQGSYEKEKILKVKLEKKDKVIADLKQKLTVENKKLEDKLEELENAICQNFGSEDCPQNCKVCLKNGKANNEIEILKKIHKEKKEKCEEKCILNKENKILKAELEKKDKIIDLMSKHIAENDSDLCEYIDLTTKCNRDNIKSCAYCIKQYFKRRIEC